MIIMALLLAYFYRDRFWKRAILVISAVPITIISNSFRIAMTGILYKHFGASAAEGFFHGFSGWFIFMFALAILLFEMWVLSRFKGIFGNNLVADAHGQKQVKDKILTADTRRHTQTKERDIFPDDDVREKPSAASQIDGIVSDNDINASSKKIKPTKPIKQIEQKRFFKAFFSQPQFIVAFILLSATLALSQGMEFREKIPMKRSFAGFPLQVGQWAGKRDVMEQKFIDELDFKDYIIVDYRDEKTGKMVNFYTAYYDTQRKGESIHSPETCLPGGGWEFRKAGKTTVTLSPEKMTINRAFIVQGATRQLTYFWFPLRDRIATNLWQVKLYNFWDALTRQRTDGALVRLVTPVYKDEEVENADRRLVAFTQAIVPVLEEFLPK
jgi:EpsI family protein